MSVEPKQPQGLVPGRIVHYTDINGFVRPAMVLAASPEGALFNQQVDLWFFSTYGGAFRTGIEYDAHGRFGTWHWMFEGQEHRYRSDPPAEMPKLYAEGTVEELKREVGFTKDAIGYADERVKQHERKHHLDKIESAEKPLDRYALWAKKGDSRWFIRDLLSMNILASDLQYEFGAHVCTLLNRAWRKMNEAKA